MYKFAKALLSDEVARWLEGKLNLPIVPPYVAMGIVDDLGRIKGAWVWSEYTGHNIELSVYAPGCLTRRVLREGFDYAFNTAKVSRITQRVPAMDTKLNAILQKAGFKFEGIQRKFYGNDDAMMYGMLREECKFLP